VKPKDSEKDRAVKLDEELLDAQDIEDVSVFEYVPPPAGSRGITFRFLALVLRVVWRKRFLFGLFMLALLGGVFYFYKAGYIGPEQIVLFLKSHPALAPVVFMLIYAVMAAALLPTMPFNLAAGFLWGTYVGTAYTVIGATSGALVAFIASRYFFRERVSKILQSRAWRWLDNEIRHKGWRTVAFTRVNPIFPFGPVNWFFGISSISIGNYIWATAVFIIPPALFISAIGSSIGGFVLTGEVKVMFQDVLLASAALTLLVVGRPLVTRYLLKKDSAIPRN
jgi:uncharacterized membrane protein YdjX (TVP38/TMEM64 family)